MTSFASQLARLPSAPAEGLSDKYLFLDTRKVIADMQDMGFEVSNFRYPKARTVAGRYGLHEVEFRRPQDIGSGLRVVGEEVPRILLLNSYDGSRKAQLMAGVFRLVCSNGLVAGNAFTKQKFVHMGNYEADLHEAIKMTAETTNNIFNRIEAYKGIYLEDGVYLELAAEASRIRFPEAAIEVNPEMILQPRRREDMKKDLWTTFNRIQENLVRGGITGRDAQGRVRSVGQLANIEKSNQFNAALWDLAEDFATSRA